MSTTEAQVSALSACWELYKDNTDSQTYTHNITPFWRQCLLPAVMEPRMCYDVISISGLGQEEKLEKHCKNGQGMRGAALPSQKTSRANGDQPLVYNLSHLHCQVVYSVLDP